LRREADGPDEMAHAPAAQSQHEREALFQMRCFVVRDGEVTDGGERSEDEAEISGVGNSYVW
jgi:hypothetical protein